jgi:hypothetical protein
MGYQAEIYSLNLTVGAGECKRHPRASFGIVLENRIILLARVEIFTFQARECRDQNFGVSPKQLPSYGYSTICGHHD